jgi:hypothetical protein
VAPLETGCWPLWGSRLERARLLGRACCCKSLLLCWSNYRLALGTWLQIAALESSHPWLNVDDGGMSLALWPTDPKSGGCHPKGIPIRWHWARLAFDSQAGSTQKPFGAACWELLALGGGSVDCRSLPWVPWGPGSKSLFPIKSRLGRLKRVACNSPGRGGLADLDGGSLVLFTESCCKYRTVLYRTVSEIRSTHYGVTSPQAQGVCRSCGAASEACLVVSRQQPYLPKVVAWRYLTLGLPTTHPYHPTITHPSEFGKRALLAGGAAP